MSERAPKCACNRAGMPVQSARISWGEHLCSTINAADESTSTTVCAARPSELCIACRTSHVHVSLRAHNKQRSWDTAFCNSNQWTGEMGSQDRSLKRRDYCLPGLKGAHWRTRGQREESLGKCLKWKASHYNIWRSLGKEKRDFTQRRVLITLSLFLGARVQVTVNNGVIFR